METQKNMFLTLDDEKWKSFLLDNTNIQLSSKKYKDAAEMLNAAENKSMLSLTKTKAIALSGIEKLTYLENADTLTIHYMGEKTALDFGNTETVKNVAAAIAQIRNLSLTQGSQSTWSAIAPPLLGLGVTAVFTFLINGIANEIAAGKTVNTSGRRAWLKSILTWLAELLGPIGSLAVGALLAGLFLYLIYKAYKNPSNQFVYS